MMCGRRPKCLFWYLCLSLLLVLSFTDGTKGQVTSLTKMPNGERQNGLNALLLAGIGGGLGAALGALDGPVRAATLAAAGGCTGGLVGGFMEESGGRTVIGALTGGYVGGLLGGFVGGTTGQVADSFATFGSAAILGFSATVAGNEAYGFPGAVAGAAAGTLAGIGIGKLVVGPATTVAASGIFGALGAGVGSYLGSTDLAGRPR